MYENYYGLRAKPFSLRPDPTFFFGSQGHKRALAYLDYGLEQREGFIVITGDIGAGKTTLVRNLLGRLPADQIVAAQLSNTYLGTEDTLRMVLAGFGVTAADGGKSVLLLQLETFLRDCDRQGRRALLVVDEAQNLQPRAVEELRMLSNFQTDDRSLLQTFLLGQPEFRRTLHSPELHQLRQRVIATYHLGPMDEPETRAYIEHRLHTVGWRGDPQLSDDAHAAIYAHSGGIPRSTNQLCDRLLLMGYLDDLHHFDGAAVATVLRDLQAEALPAPAGADAGADPGAGADDPGSVNQRLVRVERSVVSVLHVLKRIVATPSNATSTAHLESLE